jgi:hypothetical protein
MNPTATAKSKYWIVNKLNHTDGNGFGLWIDNSQDPAGIWFHFYDEDNGWQDWCYSNNGNKANWDEAELQVSFGEWARYTMAYSWDYGECRIHWHKNGVYQGQRYQYDKLYTDLTPVLVGTDGVVPEDDMIGDMDTLYFDVTNTYQYQNTKISADLHPFMEAPEPMSLLLLGLGTVAMMRRRR